MCIYLYIYICICTHLNLEICTYTHIESRNTHLNLEICTYTHIYIDIYVIYACKNLYTHKTQPQRPLQLAEPALLLTTVPPKPFTQKPTRSRTTTFFSLAGSSHNHIRNINAPLEKHTVQSLRAIYLPYSSHSVSAQAARAPVLTGFCFLTRLLVSAGQTLRSSPQFAQLNLRQSPFDPLVVV
jgi:hypothetical protein